MFHSWTIPSLPYPSCAWHGASRHHPWTISCPPSLLIAWQSQPQGLPIISESVHLPVPSASCARYDKRRRFAVFARWIWGKTMRMGEKRISRASPFRCLSRGVSPRLSRCANGTGGRIFSRTRLIVSPIPTKKHPKPGCFLLHCWNYASVPLYST